MNNLWTNISLAPALNTYWNEKLYYSYYSIGHYTEEYVLIHCWDVHDTK